MGTSRDFSGRAFWLQGFDLDARSLAAFRIAMGVVLIFQSVWQWSVLPLFYSGEGILPLKVLFELPERSVWAWSVHFISEEVWFVVLLGIVQGLAAVGLALGWKTRWMTVLCWMLYASASARNPYVGSGSVLMVKVLLFWAMFLPLSARWSLDARAGKSARVGERVAGMPAVGLVLQYCFIYWFTAWLKSDAMWTKEFTAFSYALRLDEYASAFGQWLLRFPELLKVMTVGTLVIEFVAPVLVILPFGKGWLRLVGVGLLIVLHAGVLATMKIPGFALVGMIAGVAMLPACFWRSVETKFGMRSFGARAVPVGNRSGGMGEWVRDGVLVLLLVLVLASNMVSKDENRWGWMLRQPVLGVLQATHLKQQWPLFAPRPYANNGWTMVEARAADGRRYNMVNGQRLHGRNSMMKPEERADDMAMQEMSHWRILSYKILKAPPAVKEALVGGYMRRWNEREGSGREVTTAQLLRVQFFNLPDGSRGPAQVMVLWDSSEPGGGAEAAKSTATAEGEAKEGEG